MDLAFWHGGDLDAISRAYSIPKEELINFSGNVNPLGPPESVKEAIRANVHLLAGYPDAGYEELRARIGRYNGVPGDRVIVGNGSTELISLFIKSRAGRAGGRKKAVILAPSYSEYGRIVNQTGLERVDFPLREEDGFALDLPALLARLDESVSLFIACNPNNPTGTALRHGQMERILAHCDRAGIAVMVDETYAEFADATDVSTAPLTSVYENLFTVRGTSKFFAAPGLRLGYGLCGSGCVLDAINEMKDPWSVSVLAEVAGKVMFSDAAYIQRTKELISSERAKMRAELGAWPGIRLYGSEANFLLIRLRSGCPLTSAEIFEKMIQKRLVIRDCKSFSTLDDRFIRICVMRPEENKLLLTHLKEVITSENK